MRTGFADFVLDAGTRELRRGEEVVHLSTKAFLLLELLISRAPNALSKEEMYKHIWGEAFVEEVNLPNLISEIRGALGESRKEPRFIKTLHGFGYSFAAPLQRVAERSPALDSEGRILSLCWGRDEFALKNGENIIGRGDEADVIIDSASVSRKHARVVVSAGIATIEDLGSKNGTYVHGARIEASTQLASGDVLRIGFVNMTIRSSNRADTTMSQMSS